jgi:steroid delta-isomerase-like uncharacterized protein
MPNDPQVEALCREYHAAMWEHDWDRIAACFHADIVWEDTALLQRYEGRESVIRFFKESFPPLGIRVNLNWLTATAEAYCVDTWVEGKHVADLPGLPATGKSFGYRVISIGKIRDGKIVNGIDAWSLSSMLHQLGIGHLADAMVAAGEAHQTF